MSGAVVIGAGPGIGQSVALRFAQEGLPVAVVARTKPTVEAAAEAVAALGVRAVALTADSTDERALRAALDAAADELGPPDVVVYNAAIIQADSPGELSVRAHQDAWAVNVVGAVNAAAHVMPAMAQRGSGTFIITGGMPEPKPQYVSLSLGKAGVRSLTKLLDLEYGPSGVHVATVTVDGAVAPGTAFDPDDIAEHYWRLHSQPRDQWQLEVVHAESTSTEDTAAARGVIAELLGVWRRGFDEHRPADIAALFAEDALFQGVSPLLRVGPTAVSGYYDQVAEGTTATVEMLTANQLGDGIVAGFADVVFTAPTGETTPVRLSIVAQRINGRWLIRQYHAALAH